MFSCIDEIDTRFDSPDSELCSPVDSLSTDWCAHVLDEVGKESLAVLGRRK
jgi:hypothetical protein